MVRIPGLTFVFILASLPAMGAVGEPSLGVLDFQAKADKAASGLANSPGISADLANRLVSKGFVSLEVFDSASAEDLVEAGFSPAEAAMVMDIVSQARNNPSSFAS